jgi:hypothetical protein
MKQLRLEIVYSYRTYTGQPGSAGAWILSKYKATREAIELLGCEVVEGTDEQVPASELLPDGRYMPSSLANDGSGVSALVGFMGG